ncbi:hypothetical protein HDV05_001497 [Chytridiales sp. JEL 0842]|nr:hypothetical protein HDV05_001497 [Chytridiales sp. JEL 0842]
MPSSSDPPAPPPSAGLPPTLPLRICNLLFFALQIYVNFLFSASPRDGSSSYDRIIWVQPAGSTFAIWGVIYTLQTIFVILQLLPSTFQPDSESKKQIDERISYLLILSTLLNGSWLIVFPTHPILGFFILVGLSLTLLTILYRLHPRTYTPNPAPLLTPPPPSAESQPLINNNNNNSETLRDPAGEDWVKALIRLPWRVYTPWVLTATTLNFLIAFFPISSNIAPGATLPVTLVALGVLLGAWVGCMFYWEDVLFGVVGVWALWGAWRGSEGGVWEKYKDVSGVVLLKVLVMGGIVVLGVGAMMIVGRRLGWGVYTRTRLL